MNMLSLATIKARLSQAGLDSSLAEWIRKKAIHEAEPEDFLQEAIVTALSGGSVTAALSKLAHQDRHTVSLDSLLESEDGTPREIGEKETSDNERPDWIPNDPAVRAGLIVECKNEILKTYRLQKKAFPNGPKAPGCFQGRVRIAGKTHWIGVHKTNAARGAAERIALRKIIGWCLPLDDSTFTTVCVECGGAKSKYGVRFCRACIRSGAQRRWNAAEREKA